MHNSTRRHFIRLAVTATALAATSLTALAEDRVIKVGTLKLIHGITPYFYEKFVPAGVKVVVVPFESPTDGKNAVVTGSVDFGIFGLAAATSAAPMANPWWWSARPAIVAWPWWLARTPALPASRT